MRQNNQAQTMLEYVFLIAVLVAGLLLMVHFLQVRLQGKLKSNLDEISEKRQFEQNVTNTTIRISTP